MKTPITRRPMSPSWPLSTRLQNDTMGELWEWAYERKKSVLENKTPAKKKAVSRWWTVVRHKYDTAIRDLPINNLQ